MNPREVYEQNPDFNGREEQFKLRPHEWEFYLRLDGRRSVHDIGHAIRLEMQWLVPTVERLEKMALIRVVEIGMEEFYRRFVNPPAAAIVSNAAPVAPPAPSSPAASTAVSPSALAGVPAPAPLAAGDTKRVSFSLRRGASPTVRPAPQSAPVPIPNLAAIPVPAAEEFHLKPLLDFVIGQSGGGTVGQLAVYRVFLKVPNELLREAGIKSLKLFDADFTFRHTALRHSLLAAVEEVVGRPYIPGAASQPVPASAPTPTGVTEVPDKTIPEPLAV